MTRNELIAEIMRQIQEVLPKTDWAGQIEQDILFRLRLSHTAVLREIYATNAVDLAVARAYLTRQSSANQ